MDINGGEGSCHHFLCGGLADTSGYSNERDIKFLAKPTACVKEGGFSIVYLDGCGISDISREFVPLFYKESLSAILYHLRDEFVGVYPFSDYRHKKCILKGKAVGFPGICKEAVYFGVAISV